MNRGGALWFGCRLLLTAPGRLVAAVAAVAAATLILAIEIGFFFGVVDSQARFAELIDGDLVLMHRAQTHLDRWNELEGIRPFQAGGVAGVRRVMPIYRGGARWRDASSGWQRRIVVLAVPADGLPLDLPGREQVAARLRVPGEVLFDRLSRDLYGDPAVGDDVELDGRRYRLGGYFELGPNLVYDGLVLMSEGEWLRAHPGDTPLFAVIELEPGASVDAVRDRLQRALPDDVLALTPAELRAREVDFTVSAAPIGYIFGLGALLGLLVGMIFSYQVLYNLVTDNQRPFATLRAMGFGRSYLRLAIVAQACLVALLGALLGLACSALVYRVIAALSHLVMALTLERAALIAAATLAFCLVAGLAAAQRVVRVEPAELM